MLIEGTFSKGKIDDGLVTIKKEDEIIVGIVNEGKFKFVRIGEDSIILPTNNFLNVNKVEWLNREFSGLAVEITDDEQS